jgi:copper transport protein
VIATASSGQLLVRLSVPTRDDLGTTNTSPSTPGTGTPDTGTPSTGGAIVSQQASPPPDYRLTARLATADGPERPVSTRPCGPGCFTSPVTWRTGPNRLLLTISAPPWPTASATLDIPWPPHPDPATLSRLLAAMRAVPAMTVHQAVTSNYTGNPGTDIPLRLSGTDYLTTEPYSTGGGNPISLPAGDGVTELRLAFPQGITVRLLLDEHARILREEETTPNHLVTSTFEYPTHR